MVSTKINQEAIEKLLKASLEVCQIIFFVPSSNQQVKQKPTNFLDLKPGSDTPLPLSADEDNKIDSFRPNLVQ